MLLQITLGCILMMITTAIHALCTAGVIKGVRAMQMADWGYGAASKRVRLLSSLVLFLAASMRGGSGSG